MPLYFFKDKPYVVLRLEDQPMAEPESHTLHLLREIRGAIGALDGKVSKIDRDQEELQQRVDSIRQAMLGESVLGRYATAEFEDRLTALD
jgi:hypothetical protein